ncbi:L-2-hydroxyglutarate oxidase [Kaistia dalseonensis]|uniref:L-2-hydroxyglutarate oxidase n=1 Tax=Kaistia dalseonensis TaxID=410840 RepID=A0ABU0H1J3_9HYPH|nr:L-2-hydroxyglutarate oxidase [Kaistia dalseonensis]MCX5493617.1 L-2-hydroxyglutarate oxidase [Kaistia dalseonensis]MDQ0436178.1 L-2-hydroxyglutarate oxidase [Kaistia dalseonensis]
MYDFIVIGGGIVGLATVRALQRRQPDARIILLEKEDQVGQHQTGHNSGVIHAGVYYAPGSLKARLCREGAEATKAFCREHDIPFDQCGKLLVATNEAELARMGDLAVRAGVNGIAVQRLSASELGEREPAIVGLGALLVESTAIVDYRQICRALVTEARAKGATIALGRAATAIRETPGQVEVDTAAGAVLGARLIACAGLQSDRIARLAGLDIAHRIIPFRGEYYVLPDALNQIVRHLIYPIPDPDLPFLGIHLTRMIDGRVTVGPNAVLGLAREGYPRFSLDLRDMADMAAFPGFWRVLKANWRSGLTEMRNSLRKSGYLEECRKYCPTLTVADLKPYPAGIRAQAVLRDGALVHDFLFADTDRMLHVLNAPSPAATSALPIGEMIADRMF